MGMQVIPLTTAPNQEFSALLTIDGNPLTLNLRVAFSEMCQYWTLTISDASNNLIIDSVPMITGGYPAANLLQQQRYLAIGSWYIVNVSNIAQDYPDNTNLGTDFQLWVGDTPTE